MPSPVVPASPSMNILPCMVLDPGRIERSYISTFAGMGRARDFAVSGTHLPGKREDRARCRSQRIRRPIQPLSRLRPIKRDNSPGPSSGWLHFHSLPPPDFFPQLAQSHWSTLPARPRRSARMIARRRRPLTPRPRSAQRRLRSIHVGASGVSPPPRRYGKRRQHDCCLGGERKTRAFSAATNPTDNKGNRYELLGSVQNYAPLWPNSGAAVYASSSSVGGAGHVFTAPMPAADEITLAAVEIKNGGVIQDYKWSKAPAGQAQTSPSVTTTGPATLIAIWTGDLDGDATGHVTAVPDNGFRTINSQTYAKCGGRSRDRREVCRSAWLLRCHIVRDACSRCEFLAYRRAKGRQIASPERASPRASAVARTCKMPLPDERRQAKLHFIPIGRIARQVLREERLLVK